jgi:hypothetical protein
MRLLKCASLIGVISCSCVLTASAGLIQGHISFLGVADLNNSMDSATAIVSYSGIMDSHGITHANPTVQFHSQSGDYLSVPTGTEVTWSPFFFGQSSVVPLWTVTVNSVTYSFDATSVTVVSQTATFLNISGDGIAHIDGFTDTLGTWSITSTGGNSTFTFGAGATATGQAPVPEATSCLGLLTLGLGSLAVLRKRLT